MAPSCKKSEEEPPGSEETLGDAQLPYAYPDWMKQIDDSRYISMITIPGTHDSGADLHTSQQGSFGEEEVICQHYYLSNQMKLGVRWFDVRLKLDDGDLLVYHWHYYLHKTFNNLLSSAIDFLNAHPSETLVFMIKQEYSSEPDHDFASAVYNYLKGHSSDMSRYFLEERIPRIEEVRGKIIIVRRFANGLTHPLGIYVNWDDNTTGKMYYGTGADYYVQDHYSLVTVDYSTKISEIKDCIEKAHNHANTGTFYLNFASGEEAPWTKLLYTADQINGPIENYLRSHPTWTHLGIIMVNFAGGADYSWDESLKRGRPIAQNFVKEILHHNDFGYEEVTIGNQVWMKKNLNVSYYRNGDVIPKASSIEEFANSTEGLWMYYNEDPTYGEWGYGKLYNWHALADPRGLAPEGYHIATDEEWAVLETYLGGSDVAGGKIKSTQAGHWLDPNAGATNESGFSALPAGIYYMGLFQMLSKQGVWWSPPGTGKSSSVFRVAWYDKMSIDRFSDDTYAYGCAVRCIKD